MHETNLRAVDLNLLVSLRALLEERSVTRAAERLGMSQPAASRALARLRALLADPLLVEGRSGYVLSVRAASMQAELGRTLEAIAGLLEGDNFDPSTATGRVRLLTPDLQAAALVPHVLSVFAREAPALDLDIVPPGAGVMEMLEDGTADAAVGLIDDAPAGMRRRKLYEEGFVTMLRRGHPDAGQLTLERYLGLGHIVVSVTGVGPTVVDTALDRLGLERRVAVRVPSFLGAMEIAARSDLAMTLPASMALVGGAAGRFVFLPPPLDLNRFAMSLVWHARRHDDPRHFWIRGVVVEAARRLADDAAAAGYPIPADAAGRAAISR